VTNAGVKGDVSSIVISRAHVNRIVAILQLLSYPFHMHYYYIIKLGIQYLKFNNQCIYTTIDYTK